MNEGRRTRGVKINFREMVQSACFVSNIEPKDHTEALSDEFWIQSMQEELEQFIRNDVWELVKKPSDGHIVGTKWIFKNKIDENGIVIRNKARLVAQGYSQIKGVDFKETFAPVALIGMACIMNFIVYQMGYCLKKYMCINQRVLMQLTLSMYTNSAKLYTS